VNYDLFILCLIGVALVVGTVYWIKPVDKPLPPPQPDERDSMRKWREICNLEET
jgi:hypothetical protein